MAEDADAIERLFAKIQSFEWNEDKRRANLRNTASTSRMPRGCLTVPPSSADRIAMAKSGIRSSGSSKGAKSRSRALSKARGAGSSRRGGRGATKGGGITVISRDDLNRTKGKTDWARVDALSDTEIAAAVQGDPDAVPLDIDWSEAVLVVPPKKKAISIRLDEDVLDFFKRGGAGYQRRMNAVLRSYMRDRKKKERA